MLVTLLLARLASAAMPLPGYDEVLTDGTWAHVNELIERSCTWNQFEMAMACTDDIDRAIERAEAFQRVVLPSPGLAYLVGLAWKYKGDDREATKHYRAALAADPNLEGAWWDLGEILLIQGDLDGAEEAFTHVAELLVDGEKAWVGPWRLAEVAAHRHDPEGFERHMREALERGFTFRHIEGFQNWKTFYADPAMRDSIDKLVNVYGDPALLESLKP